MDVVIEPEQDQIEESKHYTNDTNQKFVKKNNNDYTNGAKLVLLMLIIVVILYLIYRSHTGATIAGGSIIANSLFRREKFNELKTNKSKTNEPKKSERTWWGKPKKHVRFDLRKSTVMKFNKNDRPIDLRKNNKLIK